MCEKPIIRHCRNCEYCKPDKFFGFDYGINCEVKYKKISNTFGRIAAMFCNYFTVSSSQEEGRNGKTN